MNSLARSGIGAFTASAIGTINAVPFAVKGMGSRVPLAGIVDGQYHLTRADEHDKPIPNFDQHVFSAMFITGYPSESAGVGQVLNPFREAPCTYRRSIRFADGNHIKLETQIEFRENGTLASEFRIDGRACVPELTAIEPTVETWTPLDKHHIGGVFVMTWRSADGALIRAIAETQYYLPKGIGSLVRNQYRWIDIQASGDYANFRRHQVSTLFSSLGDLTKEDGRLGERRAV